MKELYKCFGVVVFLAVLGAGVCSCASYTYVKAWHTSLKPNTKIGLVMWDSVQGFGSMNQRAMEGYLTGTLTAKRFRVTVLSYEFMLGEALKNRLIPNGTFSGRLAVVNGLSEGGSIQGKDSADLMRELATALETDDAVDRLEGLRTLKSLFVKDKKIDFILAVERFGYLGYTFYLIDSETDSVISTFTIHANDNGMKQILGDPPKYGRTRSPIGDEEYAPLLRIASHVADIL